jgi:allantoicase
MTRQDLAYYRRLLGHPLVKLAVAVVFTAVVGVAVAMSVHSGQHAYAQGINQIYCAGQQSTNPTDHATYDPSC